MLHFELKHDHITYFLFKVHLQVLLTVALWFGTLDISPMHIAS